jgi:hypothetical protein
MPTSQLFIVRVTRDACRFVARARRVDEEVCGEFLQPQQLLSFLLGGSDTGSTDRDVGIAPADAFEQPKQ